MRFRETVRKYNNRHKNDLQAFRVKHEYAKKRILKLIILHNAFLI